jgi:hypothetical protein
MTVSSTNRIFLTRTDEHKFVDTLGLIFEDLYIIYHYIVKALSRFNLGQLTNIIVIIRNC